MSGMHTIEAGSLGIAYLGPPGTYSEEAALRYGGPDASYLPYASIDQAVVGAEQEEADAAVVPVENSTEGAVHRTLDLLLGTTLRVSGEIQLPIRHQLMGRVGSLGEVQVVAAHPQALAQCRRWLDSNVPHADRQPMPSNAHAAAESVHMSGLAAIAGRRAAQLYGVDILASDIEDETGNTTRFLALSGHEVEPTGNDKTSIICSVPNQTGSLYRMLGILADHGINMTKIESRPAKGSRWEYDFHIDLEGHALDAAVAAALKEMQTGASLLKIAGSYPRDPTA